MVEKYGQKFLDFHGNFLSEGLILHKTGHHLNDFHGTNSHASFLILERKCGFGKSIQPFVANSLGEQLLELRSFATFFVSIVLSSLVDHEGLVEIVWRLQLEFGWSSEDLRNALLNGFGICAILTFVQSLGLSLVEDNLDGVLGLAGGRSL